MQGERACSPALKMEWLSNELPVPEMTVHLDSVRVLFILESAWVGVCSNNSLPKRIADMQDI